MSFGGFGRSTTTGFGTGGGTFGQATPGATPGGGFGAGTGFGASTQQSTGFGATSAFGQQPATGGGFGASTTASPFGQQTTATGFGTAQKPAFGAQTPAFGGSGATGFGGGGTTGGFGSTLGGATPGASMGFGGGGGTTTGGLFGSPGPAGGTSTGFGGTATPAFGAGGATGGAFGQQATGGAFGAAGSAFGATPSATGGAFGGGATGGFGGGTSTGFGGGLGGAATTTSPWGAGVGAARAPQPGTGNPPYKPVQHHDNNSNMPVYIQAITAMDAFKEKSFEELRWEDYQRGNNKGTGAAGLSPLGQAGGLGLGGGSPFGGGLGTTTTGGGLGGFGGATSAPGAFGSTTATFGGTATPAGGGFGFGSAAKPAGTFGAATSTTPGAFGSTSTTPLFGQTPGLGGGAGTTAGFGSALGGGAFGAPAPAPAPSPFGAPAAAPSPFGAPATSAFGSTTLGGTFGAPAAGTTTTSPFGATTGGFGATAAKTPSPGGFGGFGTPASTSAFGTPAPSLGGAATGLKPFGSTFGAPAAAPAPAPGVGLGGFGTPAPAPAGGFGGFGATTTQTPSFSTGAFGAKPAASTATSTPAPSFSFATPSTFGPGGIGSTTQGAAPTGTTGGFLGGFGGTPAPAPASSSFGATTPFASPSFSLGGQTMQSALGGQTPAPAGFGAGAFATPAQQPGQAAQFYTPQTGGLPVLPDQRPLQILVSGSGGKRGSGGRGLRSEGLETTPPALQSYRHTPRSAAKILPRGLRSLGAGAGTGAGGAGDDGYYASIVSPGSDSFAGRGPKHLDIGAADDEDNVFAAESKVLDLDDVRRLQEREQQQQQQQQQQQARPSPPPAPAAMHYPPAQPSPQQMGRGVGVGVEEAKASVSSRRGLGVAPTLTRPGYFTTPPLEDLREMTVQELRRVVGFAVTREGVGRIQWEGETDVAGLDLDAIVAIDPKQVRVYEDVARKDPEGTKLNKPALVTLFSVRHKRKAPEEYARYLDEVTASWDGARFVSYDTETGRWVFEVAHFSKYGVADDDDDSDDDDDDGFENRAGATNQRRQPPPPPPPAEGKGAAYGVADSDGESESVEGGIVMVTEKDWQGAPEEEEGEERGAEMRSPPEEELELPPVGSRRLSGGVAYGLEQGGRVRTLANIFGEDEEEAREREAEEAEAARRFDEDLAWGRRQQQQQQPLVWGSEAMEEEADLLAPPVPKPPRAPKPPAAAFTFVDPELTRGLGAVGNSTASGATAGVPELFRPKTPASAAVQGARRKPVDYSVFMGRSFRVAWGPHGTLGLPVLRPAPHDARKLERALAVKPLPAARSGAAADPQALVGPLGVHKAFSLQVAPGTATAAPRFALLLQEAAAAADGGRGDAVALYWHLVHCLQALAKEAGERDEELACQAWELVNALWGQEGRGKERPLPLGGSLAAIGDALLRARGGANHNDWERRRQAVGRWLKRAVRQESERTPLKASGDEAADLQAVLNLMKSHRLEEAAELAADAGFLRLATLIPLAGHRPFTALIDSQPALRRGLQDRALADIYALLGGCREGPAGDPGLDWLRALGAYLWFTTDDMPTGAAAGGGPVPMDRLVAAIQEFNDRRPAPPLPAWLRARYEAGGVTAMARQHDARRGPNSVLYDLLQLYRTERHPLALLLDPRGLTENELDYRLPWLLMTLLRALGLLDGGAEVEAEVARVWQHVASGLVYQLVGAGLWQWAVYVLLHGPGGGGEAGDKDKGGPLRTTLVRELVGRHAWDPTHWAFLEGMGVPHAWLEEARAAYLRSAGVLFWDGAGADGLGEDDALGRALAAGDWRAGTELMLNVVAPRLLTGDRGAQVLRMLNRLAAAGPPGREGVGGALELAARTCREYTQFCDDLGAGRWAEAEQRLAALLPHLVHGGGGGGGGGHDKGGGCFAWRADRLGPEEAGLRRSMYDQGEEGGEGEEDATTTPPALRAIRDMVLTDVVTKCFFFHSFNASAEAGAGAGAGGGFKSVFPRRSQLCRVDEMMGDYAVKQVNTLLSNYTMVHLDGGEV